VSREMIGLMLIGGDLVRFDSGDWIDFVNPATEEGIVKIRRANAVDCNKAIGTAKAAQPEWAGWISRSAHDT